MKRNTKFVFGAGAVLALVLGVVVWFYMSLKPQANLGFTGIDEAKLRQMTAADWRAKLNDKSYRCMGITEQQFGKLSVSAKSAMQQEAITLLNELKPSLIWYMTEADKLSTTDAAKSKQYLEAAKAISESLQDSKRIQILQDAGRFYKTILDNPQLLKQP